MGDPQILQDFINVVDVKDSDLAKYSKGWVNSCKGSEIIRM
jgi:hypothetical protein